MFGVKDGVTDFPAVIPTRFATLGFDCVELPPEPLEGDAAKHIVSYAAERGVEIVFSCGFAAEHDMASDDPEVRQNGARYMERVLSVMDGGHPPAVWHLPNQVAHPAHHASFRRRKAGHYRTHCRGIRQGSLYHR